MILGMKTRTILASVAIAAASVTASYAQDKITVPSATHIAAADVPADAIVVNIDKLKYETPELTIKAGDTVYWVNKEVMPHNVAFKAGVVGEAANAGPMMSKDQAYSITFNEAGTFDYFCTPHPFMRGKVIVE